jgi:hypothetical protein
MEGYRHYSVADQAVNAYPALVAFLMRKDGVTSQNAQISIKSKRIIEYLPPSYGEIHQFAKAVCKQLGTGTDNKETIQGLTEFLTIVAQIKAKQMSSGGDHDQE